MDPVSVDQVRQKRPNIERGICLTLKLFEVVRNPPAPMDSLPFRLVQMGEDPGELFKLLNIDLIRDLCLTDVVLNLNPRQDLRRWV